jgi:hypothetical protein
VQELKLLVPTYYGDTEDKPVFASKKEFDQPNVPVLICEGEGIRLVLGSHDDLDCNKPDIQIERRPSGWAIFLHPDPCGDASGFVYFLDDGRSFLVPEYGSGQIRVLNDIDQVPGIDAPPIDQNRFPGSPKLSAAWVQAQTAIRGRDANDGDRGALLALVEALENVGLSLGESTAKADAIPHVVVPQTENAG